MDPTAKMLFRFFMTTQACKEDYAATFLKQLISASSSSEISLKACIEEINEIINPQDLEISSWASETTGESVLALISTSKSTVSEHAKFHDKKTLRYFSNIMRNCLLSEEGHVPEIDCLNMSIQADLSKFNAQQALRYLVQHFWLENKDGKIYLGPRTFAEFGQLITRDFSTSVQKCHLCKRIALFVENCTSCDHKFHVHCIEKYLKMNKSCPECKNSWNASGVSSSDDVDTGSPNTKRARLINDEL